MEITIRKLQENDIEALSRIEAASFSMPWSADAFRDLLLRPYCTYLVAVAEGKVIGCCGYTDICNEANIDNVVVDPAYRNRGVGKAMMSELLKTGRAAGVKAYTLEVRVSNHTAIHLYENFGFRSEGIRPKFYEKPIEDASIMWLRDNEIK